MSGLYFYRCAFTEKIRLKKYKLRRMELHLIIGPMFAGKSTELIRIARRYISIGKNILVVNHSLNNRYNTDQITTHNQNVFEGCVVVSNLADVKSNDIDNADVILIEELQFFPDAFQTVIDWVEKKSKIVIAAGLDGDSNRNMFGDVLRLIPYSNTVTKMSSLCKLCGDGTLAHFTKKKIPACQIISVGAEDIYEAVCRKHLINH